MKKYLKLLIFTIAMIASVNSFAQSPFKRLKPPTTSVKLYSVYLNDSSQYIVSDPSVPAYKLDAYRFTPFAGYAILNSKVEAGLGFGFNKMHWVDSTQRYYSDLSIMVAILAGGSTTPTITNFGSIGIGFGFLNQKIIIVPCYDIPTPTLKGRFNLVLNIGIPL